MARVKSFSFLKIFELTNDRFRSANSQNPGHSRTSFRAALAPSPAAWMKVFFVAMLFAIGVAARAAEARCNSWTPSRYVVCDSVATSAHTAVARMVIRPGQDRGMVSPQDSPIDANAFPNQDEPLIGWTYYNTGTCTTISTGSWDVTDKPKDGDTPTAIVDGTLGSGAGSCAGYTLQFNEIYYDWTNLKTTDKTDTFAATWTSPGGSEPETFDITLATSKLTVIDPYRMNIPSDNTLSVEAVVDAFSADNADANGLMADGSWAAIAVFGTNQSAPVTFTVTNGAKVAAYNTDFLTSASGGSSDTVEVTPTKIDGEYYAVALVIGGTPPSAEIGLETKVTGVTKGLSNSASSSLLTLPTPVVFIHGLWGNASSLASTVSFLNSTEATFQLNPYLLTPICYSVYIAFDAATDTVPGHGAGCENTSADALNNYFTKSLAPQLKQDGFVGGRVDAVVHSMGGLVVRHYSATPGYKSIQNRNLGAFRNVITLDTPETGSALATYLDGAYNRTLQVTTGTPYTLWSHLCPSPKTDNIETCFFGAGLPLAYKGMALTTGAVASLIPGGKSIASAPAPTIFNTGFGKWYAIASDFKDGDKPASLLRDLLNNLVAATYAKGQTPPTLTGILGTSDSDVIVTVASQTSEAVSAQTKQFKDLEHTPAPTSGFLLFLFDTNNSVVDWPAVNQQAAYWLGLVETAQAGRRMKAPTRPPAPAPNGRAGNPNRRL